ncbi:MAG: MFS transporter [Candidatus Aenigmarchaeota archaeon]|nr:MFS transporter [Candidatus Aenigmarchaeota archaeon]
MKFGLPRISKDIASLFIATFFIAFSVTMMSPILPEIKNEFQLSYTAASLLLSSFAVSRLILSIPSGYLYEKTNKKNLLIGGIALLSAGSLIAGLSSGFLMFLASQVIMGAGFSICITTVIVSLSSSATKENRGKLLGMNSFVRSVGGIIAPTLAGIIAVIFAWRNVFLFYAAISVLCIVLLYFFFSGEVKRPAEKEEEAEMKNYKQTLYGLFAIMLLTNIVFMGFRGSAVPLFASDVLKLDSGQIGFLLSVSAFVFLIFAPVSAYLSDRHGRKVFMVLSTLAFTLSVFGFLVAKNEFHLMLLMGLFGYGSIIFVSSTAMLGDITQAKHASKNYSMMRFISDFGMVIGPVATGLLLDSYGFKAVGWLLGALSFVAFIIALYVIEEPKYRLDLKRLLNIATFGRFGE